MLDLMPLLIQLKNQGSLRSICFYLFYASTVPNGFKAIYSEAPLRYSLHMLDLMPLLIQLKNQGSLRNLGKLAYMCWIIRWSLLGEHRVGSQR
ncbi:hypothetical protein SLE2022_366760 [Rubroshorea leprosula]